MDVLKAIGYVLAGILVVAILCAVTSVIAAIGFLVGLALLAGSVVAFVAFCIKDYCETKPARPKPGDQGTKR